MPHLLLLMKVSVMLFLVPADECRQVSDSAESNPQPIESKLLPFLINQQASKSERLQMSSPTYKLAATTLSELSKPSIYSRGQEYSWYLQEPQSKKPPVLTPLISPNPQLSNLVVPLDAPFEYQTAWKGDPLSDTVPFTKAKLTIREVKKELSKRIQSSADELNDKKFLVQLLSTNYENPDQPQSSRTRPRKIKIRLKHDEPSQLAKEWYGSQNRHKSLAMEKKRSIIKKLKIFESPEQEMKFKQQLKLKVKKPKKAKKVKIYSPGHAKPLKKSWKNQGSISSRKSETLRCYKTRKQDDNSSSRTVCVTYPASWGEGVNYTIPNGIPYSYYYPYYYYPAYYYYPYYVYG